MIILTQNEKRIINFDKITKINIVSNDGQKEKVETIGELNQAIKDAIKETTGLEYDEIKGYGIYAYISSSEATMIGQYETEERAMQVFEDIVNTYDNIFKAFGDEIYTNTRVYKMPKE